MINIIKKKTFVLLVSICGSICLIGCGENKIRHSYQYSDNIEEQREINDSDKSVYRCVEDKRNLEKDGLLNGSFELISTEILDSECKVIYVLKYKETGKRYMYIVCTGLDSPATNLICLD